MDEYDQVIQTLPSWLARPLLELPSTLAPQVQEVRLRYMPRRNWDGKERRCKRFA